LVPRIGPMLGATLPPAALTVPHMLLAPFTLKSAAAGGESQVADRRHRP
jgi:hypothetical protein